MKARVKTFVFDRDKAYYFHPYKKTEEYSSDLRGHWKITPGPFFSLESIMRQMPMTIFPGMRSAVVEFENGVEIPTVLL